MASEFLSKKGYKILELNFRCRTGEIDIVAKKNNIIVFTEVKYRKNLLKGSPGEAIDYYKQQKIYKTAMYYITRNRLNLSAEYRFDAILITNDNIEHIENAF